MKRLIILLLLFSGGVHAQSIDFSQFVRKTDIQSLENKIKAQEDRIKALESGIIVTPPVVGLKDCKRGPTIVSITEITSSGITVKFDADSVFNIKYMVTGSKVFVDSIKPTSNTFRITFPSIFVNGNYTLSLEGLSCKGNNSRIFTIAGGVDPPSNTACKVQPTFKINGYTNQSATIQFDAVDLKTLTLAVVQGENNILKTTTYNPDVNTLYFNFDQKLKPGNYKIRLTPVSCTAENFNQEFTVVADETGSVDPPINTDPGSTEFRPITKGMDQHMLLTKRTVGDLDYYTDGTANPLQPNYKYYYIVGAQVITTDKPLKDYPVVRNNGFRVVKFNKKNGITTINQWPGQGEESGGYYDANAGQSFSYNISASVTTGVYSGSQSGFINYVPANYNPATQMPQWADISPDAKLPKGRFFVLTRSDWPIDLVKRKGVTHIRHHEIPRPNGDETLAFQMRLAGETYSDVPLSTTIFGGTPSNNPTKEEIQRMINLHTYPDALHIGETMEQSHAINPGSTWLKEFNAGFVANQKKQFDSKGIPSLNCFNYFQFWPNSYHLGQVSSDSSKAMFRLSPDKMPYSNFSPGAPLSTTNLIVEAVYLGPPDIQQSQPYDLAFKLMLFDKMGYTGGAFLAGVHEWRSNNFFENVYPDGKYYSQGKIPLDPNTIITAVYFSQVFGKVFVEWGGTGKVNGGRIFNDLTPEPTYWLPAGSTEFKGSTRNPDPNAGRYSHWIASADFPHKIRNGAGYYGYNAGTDFCRFGLQMYLDTWNQIPEDGVRKFLSFRIDNGAWIEAIDQYADDIINAKDQKRGIVHSINKSGKIAWYYLNPFADNLWHDLEVRFPNGRIVKNRVGGNGIHSKLEDH